PTSALFPYTTLFRSAQHLEDGGDAAQLLGQGGEGEKRQGDDEKRDAHAAAPAWKQTPRNIGTLGVDANPSGQAKSWRARSASERSEEHTSELQSLAY